MVHLVCKAIYKFAFFTSLLYIYKMIYLLLCFPCDWRCLPCHQTDSSEASSVPPHQPPPLLQTLRCTFFLSYEYADGDVIHVLNLDAKRCYVTMMMIMLRKVKFYKHVCLSSNSILYNLFYFTLTHNYTSDNMLRTVFMPQCLAVDLVYHLFYVYVG